MREQQTHPARLCIMAAVACFLVSSTMAETRICLNMIAKDEASEIVQGLEPVAAELSGWTLCDTGSTDDTIKVAESFFKNQSIPGKVEQHKWQDFGHNRNLCIEAGLKWSLAEAKRRGMPKGSHFCEYLLFLDVDQILHRPDGVKPGAIKARTLTQNGYHITEKGRDVTYSNLRLVSTRLEWSWVGEVHEFLRRKDEVWTTQYVLEDCWLHHDASGGKEGTRFVRDEAILAKAVKERPKDGRARFYLGNTLRALRRDEDALTHYMERINIGGWEEECFMSAWNIAEIAKKQWDHGKLISPQIKAAVGNWGSHFSKKINATAEELEEQQLIEAYEKLSAALNATRAKGLPEKDDPAVNKAGAVYERLRDVRRHREFPWVVAALQAAVAVLPYRPEPYAELARLHRVEFENMPKCYSFAAAGLAQGPPRKDALFLSTRAANYDLLDEVCVCGYYVENAREQGQMACRKLQQKLVTDLVTSPNNNYMKVMLNRTETNLKWYANEGSEDAGPLECSADSKTCTAKKLK